MELESQNGNSFSSWNKEVSGNLELALHGQEACLEEDGRPGKRSTTRERVCVLVVPQLNTDLCKALSAAGMLVLSILRLVDNDGSSIPTR